jgi:hypothetical protein
MKTTDYRAIALVIVGLAQMLATLLGVTPVAGLAAATVASPAPKVFSVARGLETFSTGFTLEWQTPDGQLEQLALDPHVYPRLKGPYKRRNVYGAILAFGPVLASDAKTRPMFDLASHYAMCDGAPVLRELGVDPAQVAGPLRIRYTLRPGNDPIELPTLLEVPCP